VPSTFLPLVRRMVAGNPGPMTFTETCTYVVGLGEVAVIDPGSDNKEHIAALLEALSGETVTTILVTLTHKDHSPAARALKAATGARIFGCAPAKSSGSPIDAAHDFEYAPDAVMRDGDAIETKNFSLLCVATPGHTQNHLSFALPPRCFRAIMSWLGQLPSSRPRTARCATTWPRSKNSLPERKNLLARRAGEGAAAFSSSSHSTSPRAGKSDPFQHQGRRLNDCAIVAHVYAGLDPTLTPAAAYSVLAPIEDLAEQGLVKTEGAIAIGEAFRPA
jgi:hypothetical protein